MGAALAERRERCVWWEERLGGHPGQCWLQGEGSWSLVSRKPHLPQSPWYSAFPLHQSSREAEISLECRATHVLKAASAGLFSIPWMGT